MKWTSWQAWGVPAVWALIGSATLGLILLLCRVFELDYAVAGPRWTRQACVCACGGCVCVPVSSLTAESAESTDGPTGARSKSLCMQIKKATINVAKEQGGHGGFMAPLSLFFLPPPPPPSSTVWWGLREDLEWDTQSAELSPVCSVCARLPRHGVRMKSVRASQPSQLASEWATERAPLV